MLVVTPLRAILVARSILATSVQKDPIQELGINPRFLSRIPETTRPKIGYYKELLSSSRSALASFRSAVSKPSVNQL